MAELQLWSRQDVAPEGLADVLAEAQKAAGFAYVMLEWWNKPSEFVMWAEGLAALRTSGRDCLSGSAFGDNAEVRWRRVDGRFWLALTSGAAMGLPGWRQESTEAWDKNEPKPRHVFLWGTKRTESGEWVERRIPRRLKYPSPPAIETGETEGVMLEVQEYYDDRGAVFAARRCGLRWMVQGQGGVK